MLQYLLNGTAIWLISLVMFDVFLRRESYHSYNRFYLLFTFLLGALLPLLQWQQDSSTAAIGKPLQQVIAAKQTILTATAPTTDSINWAQWLTIIYLSGVLIALCLLAVEIIKLSAVYKGNRSQQDNWTVIETGKEHAPFSFLNTLFVCSRQQYNHEEWSMILHHEKRHSSLFHVADLLLMQLARVMFWFHPLVYLYNKRLLLVHEYQADNTSARRTGVYGKFLIEQAILQSAPTLSHSFNRSPIKNRILMLTHRSSAAARTKMFVFVPLLLICLFCFSKSIFSQKIEKNGNITTYKGNRFEMSAPKIDTVYTKDPASGQDNMIVVQTEPYPIKMNGAKIYNTDEVEIKAEPLVKNGALEEYILKKFSNEFNKLPDGAYSMDVHNVIVDNQGKIVLYEYDGITSTGRKTVVPAEIEKIKKTEIPAGIKKAIEENIDPVMNKLPAFRPAKVKNEAVIELTDVSLYMYTINVKNHKTTITKG